MTRPREGPWAEIWCALDINNLLLHGAYSMRRLLIGGGGAVFTGLVIGVITGYFEIPRRILSPLVYVLAPVPKITLLPLVMMTFGIGDMAKIFLIFIIMVFQVIFAVSGAASRIPAEYFLPLKAAKAGTFFIIWRVVLPACMPELFTAVRIGLATGISALFFAEAFGTRRGLGFFIMDSWTRLNYPNMLQGIVSMALLGLALTVLTDLIERYVCRWRKQ